jgi:trehalose/maltose transport system substrate-binding protein
MTKKFTLLLVLALVVAAFSSVGVTVAQEESGVVCPEGEANITLAGGSVGAELEQAQQAGAAFSELCPNVTIEVLQMPDSASDRLAQYLQFWEAQSDEVDVFQTDVIWPAIIAPHVVDMKEYLTEEEIGMYFAGMIEGQTVDDRLVAIPWFSDAAGLYYRTDLLEKYGLEVPQTWEELEVAAQTIQDGEKAENPDFWGYVWQGNNYEGLTCDAHEWIASETGSTFITPDGEVNVNNEEAIAAIERAAGWVGTISPEGVTTYQEEDSRNTFQAGNAAFMRNWPYAYNLGNAEDSAVAGLFDWVPLPAGAAGRAACLGGWQLAVSQYSDNVEAAVAFAKYLASPELLKERALSPQGNPPTMPSVYEDADIQANDLMVRLGPILETAVARPSVATGARYNDASLLFSTAVHSVLTGETDAETAMEELEVDLEDLLAELEAGA